MRKNSIDLDATNDEIDEVQLYQSKIKSILKIV
jgi:hypothetical protein